MQPLTDLFAKPGFRQAAASFGWLVGERAGRFVFGALVGIVVARHLGPARLGALSYGIASVTLIGFLPALGLGLMIAIVAGVIYVLVWEVYLFLTHYTFMDNYTAAILAQKKAAGVSGAALQAEIAQLNAMKAEYNNPLLRMGMTFIEIFPVGVLIALISAALLRNPKVLPARG